MQRLRTRFRLVYALVALFLGAQFAGVVASPLESAHTFAHAAEMHMQHHHMHAMNMLGVVDDGGGVGHHRNDHGGGHVDHCCALHAFFAGILPPAVAIEAAAIAHQRVAASRADIGHGVAPDLLDRPPRPDVLI